MKVNEDKELSLSPTESEIIPELKAERSYCDDCRVNTVSTYPSSVELCPFHAAAPELHTALKHALQTKHDIRTCNCVGCEDARAAFAKVSAPADKE